VAYQRKGVQLGLIQGLVEGDEGGREKREREKEEGGRREGVRVGDQIERKRVRSVIMLYNAAKMRHQGTEKRASFLFSPSPFIAAHPAEEGAH
jgi:hypothetical protein